jgi:hypothetical protein
MKMSLDLSFLLLLALRMCLAAAVVVSASMIAERAGPVIGALIATLPISSGPSYVFVALDHGPGFIAQSALTALPINAATVWMSLVYVILAQRRGVLVSCTTALAVWFGLVSLILKRPWTLSEGLMLNLVAFAVCAPLLQRFRHARMPLIARQWYDLPLRAALVASLVGTITLLSGWAGPEISGILLMFPVVFTSMMLILQPRIGGPATAAVIANGVWGLMGFGLGVTAVQLGVSHLGSAAGLSLGLATCVTWNLGLWWTGRRKLSSPSLRAEPATDR